MAGLAGSLPKWDRAEWAEVLKEPMESLSPNIRARLRRHRKCIEQYVEGASIQGHIKSGDWYDATKPQFYASHNYRVKGENSSEENDSDACRSNARNRMWRTLLNSRTTV